MPTPTYFIYPPGRDWPAEAEHLAQALGDSIPSSRVHETAALGLLLRVDHRVWTRPDITAAFTSDHRPGRAAGARQISWQELAHRVHRLQGLDASDRAQLMFACGLGDFRVLVHFGACLGALTHQALGHVVEAVGYTAGPR